MFAFRSLTAKVSFSFLRLPIGLLGLLVFFSATSAEAQEKPSSAEEGVITVNQNAGKIDQLKQLFPQERGLVKELAKVIKKNETEALISNDAIIFGILSVMLALIFYTSNIKTGFWGKFYKIVPMLLVCYFLPRC